MRRTSENPERDSYGNVLGLRDAKRVQAKRRQAARDSRSDQEQLDKLVARGHGECREAQALRAKIGGQ